MYLWVLPSVSVSTSKTLLTSFATTHLTQIKWCPSSPQLTQRSWLMPLFHLGWTIALPYFLVFHMRAPKVFRWFRMLQLEFFTHTRTCDHITPILMSLHWLPVHIRSGFNVLLMTVNSLLMVPRVKKKSAGCRAFSCQAPFLWNNWPLALLIPLNIKSKLILINIIELPIVL